MATGDGFESRLLKGVATDLLNGIAAFNENGVYSAGQTGIVFDKMPQAPDDVVVLTDYSVNDDESLSDSIIGLQIRTRSASPDPRAVKDLAGLIFDVMHGLHGVDLSTGVHIVWIRRNSGTSLGQDESRRWSRSDNYYVAVHRPSSNRT